MTAKRALPTATATSKNWTLGSIAQSQSRRSTPEQTPTEGRRLLSLKAPNVWRGHSLHRLWNSL